MVLLDLVQQRPVADFQQPGRRFTVPAGLLERGGDGVSFRFSLDALHQRFQTGDARIAARLRRTPSAALLGLRQIRVPERHIAVRVRAAPAPAVPSPMTR